MVEMKTCKCGHLETEHSELGNADGTARNIYA